MKQCQRCDRMLPLAEFGVSPLTGRVRVECERCRMRRSKVDPKEAAWGKGWRAAWRALRLPERIR